MLTHPCPSTGRDATPKAIASFKTVRAPASPPQEGRRSAETYTKTNSGSAGGGSGNTIKHYRKNAVATPPSTFITLPVDLLSNPPTNAKHALAISSGRMVSLSNVRLA